MPTVLIVDDEPNIIELASLYFARDGFTVLSASDGEEARVQIATDPPSLLVLDIMMPKLDGRELCRRLRAEGNRLPIILLTARDDDIDKIVGLELGADDYVTKPFNPVELVARARALLRRRGWEQERPRDGAATLRAGELEMRPGSRQARVGQHRLTLRPREWELMEMLVQHKGEVLSRDRLLDEVWGYEFHGDTRTVDVHISALRDKLRRTGDDTITIETVWGIGYRLVEAS